MTGVELDSTTAAIAQGIYPHATIRAESFADTRLPNDYFDATVGNVPFANVTLHDPAHNAGRHSIHNHFIIKSLALTRPGGLVAVLTSHYTMDSRNPAARREMNSMADLLGAVRLPSGAHRRAAGTEAVSDLLVFRRREPGVPPADVAWETVSAIAAGDQRITLNSYFTMRPQHVLGDMSIGTGMAGAETLYVKSADLAAVPTQLRTALSQIVDDARDSGLTMTPRSAKSEERRAAFKPADPKLWDGTIQAQPGNLFTEVRGGALEPLPVPKTAVRELRALLELRDAATALLEAEAATIVDTTETDTMRTTLRERYDSYKVGYGPLNRFTLRPTGRVDEETGEPQFARITPKPIALLRKDPFGPLVMALEVFDEETQTAAHAALLKQRVVVKRPVVQGAETPAEAIALSLDRTGTIDLETIAHLLGVDEADARAGLGELVYDDPATGELVHAPEYLSGDVRVKLDQARAAVLDDERFAVNVAALERAQPTKLTSAEIHAQLGAVWIDPPTHAQFLQEVLGDRSITVENPLPGQWKVTGGRHTIKATSDYGTRRRPGGVIAEALMEQREIKVMDEYEELGRTRMVFNPLETTAAIEKGQALQERFSEWVWEDAERAERLADVYNRRFNSIVLRDYKGAGEYLTLPGMAANFVLHEHQRNAVARGIAEPAVGLFHVVGAGKTAEMVTITSELRRMGLVNKPAVVVPNHMLEQFGREWLQLYPRARVLAASSEDLTGDKRRLFVARAAANDWDAIIMTQGAFQRIPLSADAEAAYIQREVDRLRETLDAARADGTASTIKQIEKAVLNMEEAQKKLLDRPRDPGISFESTGIDYVVVDEVHMYKNLRTDSKIQDANIQGSGHASDLHMKLEYLRGRHGGRVATVATATPLSNSITEAYVMQRYLRPDLLEAAGIRSFDSWAATFGQTVTSMEMAPTGNGNFRLKTRFAKFQNVPELLRMWHVFADVKTAEDLNLPTPLLRARPDGLRAPETIVLQPTAELQEYITDIGKRAEAVANKSVRPEEDNMLKISTDGRKGALDMRLVRAVEPTGITKLDVIAANVLAEWRATRDNIYTDVVTGEESAVRGGLQLIFSDLGTPSDRWNVYDELRMKLVEGGMPARSIRFIHEAKNDNEKARLFAAARGGHVSVLIGSTSKMGQGTNVQARMTKIHHADVPWRPSDVEQRDGRGMRQGNQNAELGIARYVVEHSFDAYSWQMIQRKATFIAQIMRGKLDVREIEDIGDTAMSASEAKALSSGNPLLLEKANADNALSRLQRLERAYQRDLINLGSTRSRASMIVGQAEADIEQLRIAAARAVDTSGEAFRMTVAGSEFDSRIDAGHAIGKWAAATGLRHLSQYATFDLGEMGEVGGFRIDVRAEPLVAGGSSVILSLRDVPRSSIVMPRETFLEGGVGVVRQLENRAAGIPRAIGEVEQIKAASEEAMAEADVRLGMPFKHAEELAAAVARVAAVDRDLAEQAAAKQREGQPEPATPAVSDAATIARLGFGAPATGATTAAVSSPSPARQHDDALASEIGR